MQTLFFLQALWPKLSRLRARSANASVWFNSAALLLLVSGAARSEVPPTPAEVIGVFVEAYYSETVLTGVPLRPPLGLVLIASELARKGQFANADRQFATIRAQARTSRDRGIIALFWAQARALQYLQVGGLVEKEHEGLIHSLKREIADETLRREIDGLSLDPLQEAGLLDEYPSWSEVSRLAIDLGGFSDRESPVFSEALSIPKSDRRQFSSVPTGSETTILETLRKKRWLTAIQAQALENLWKGLDAQKTGDSASAAKSLERALLQASMEPVHARLQFESLMGLGDLAVSPYGDVRTLGYDLASDAVYRERWLRWRSKILLPRSDWPRSADSLDRAESFYRQATAVCASAHFPDCPYRLAAKRAFLELQYGQGSAAATYREAAEAAKKAGYIREGALALASASLLGSDASGFQEAVSLMVGQEDIGGVVSLGQMAHSYSERLLISSDQRGALRRLRFAVDALRGKAFLHATLPLLYSLNATYQILGNIEAAHKTQLEVLETHRRWVAAITDNNRIYSTSHPDANAYDPGRAADAADAYAGELLDWAAGQKILTTASGVPLEWARDLSEAERQIRDLSREFGRLSGAEVWYRQKVEAQSMSQAIAALPNRVRSCQGLLTLGNELKTRLSNQLQGDPLSAASLEAMLSECSPEAAATAASLLDTKLVPFFWLQHQLQNQRVRQGNWTDYRRLLVERVSGIQSVSDHLTLALSLGSYNKLADWTNAFQSLVRTEPSIADLAGAVLYWQAVSQRGLGRLREAQSILTEALSSNATASVVTNVPERLVQQATFYSELADVDSLLNLPMDALAAWEGMWRDSEKLALLGSGLAPQAAHAPELAELRRADLKVSATNLARLRVLQQAKPVSIGKPPAADEVQKAVSQLPDGVTALIYHVRTGGITVWKANRTDGLRMWRLDIPIRTVVRDLLELQVGLSSRVDTSSVAATLFEKLIAPVGQLPNGHTLVILGSSSLGLLPFEVLRPIGGRPLGEMHPIIYASCIGTATESLPAGRPKEGTWLQVNTMVSLDRSAPLLASLADGTIEAPGLWEGFFEHPEASFAALAQVTMTSTVRSLNNLWEFAGDFGWLTQLGSMHPRWLLLVAPWTPPSLREPLLGTIFDELKGGSANPAQALRSNRLGAEPGDLLIWVHDLANLRNP